MSPALTIMCVYVGEFLIGDFWFLFGTWKGISPPALTIKNILARKFQILSLFPKPRGCTFLKENFKFYPLGDYTSICPPSFLNHTQARPLTRCCTRLVILLWKPGSAPMSVSVNKFKEIRKAGYKKKDIIKKERAQARYFDYLHKCPFFS